MGYAIAAVLTKRDVHGHVSWRRGQTLNPPVTINFQSFASKLKSQGQWWWSQLAEQPLPTPEVRSF